MLDVGGDGGEVMRDQNYGLAQISIQMAEQFIELRLLGGIYACGGLVQEEQIGIGDQGAGYEHPLLLSSG